jgi:murein DD-endopeptidase MepM/ murein hydrolase activator NlpD
MTKDDIKRFSIDNKIAFTAIAVSVTFTIVVIIILYVKFRKMKTAIAPLKGRVTSKFGKRSAPVAGASTSHNGVDIAAAAGTPIVSTLAGTVSEINTTKQAENS